MFGNEPTQGIVLDGNRGVRRRRLGRSALRWAGRWACRGGIALAAIVALVLMWRGFTHNPAFAVSRVDVTGVVRTPTATVQSFIASVRGANLFTLDLDALRQKWSNRGWIQAVYLRKRFPSTLSVCLVERNPRAVLETRGSRFIVGDDAVIIDSWNNRYAGLELPLILGSPSFRDGLLKGLDFIKEASARPEFLKRVKFIDAMDKDRVGVELIDVPYRIILGDGRFMEKIDKYCRVEAQIQREEQAPGVVNLAFRNQVIINQAR